MKSKILITGKPRSGKSTLMNRLIKNLQNDFNIYGFLTPELRKNNKRIGFCIEDIHSKKRFLLARVGDYNTQYKLGRYSVFVEEFDKYVGDLYESVKKIADPIFCIDEIGKMELFSNKFQDFIRSIFQTNNIIIATIGQKIKHPIKDYMLTLPNLALFNLNHRSQDEVFTEIVSLVK